MNEHERALVGIVAKTDWPGGELPGLRRRVRSRLRLRGPEGDEQYFHVMSRLAAGVEGLDEVEKEALSVLLEKMAVFCGLELLTWCVMGNHFHALAREPAREGQIIQIAINRLPSDTGLSSCGGCIYVEFPHPIAIE